jgi:hypothetical protein
LQRWSFLEDAEAFQSRSRVAGIVVSTPPNKPLQRAWQRCAEIGRGVPGVQYRDARSCHAAERRSVGQRGERVESFTDRLRRLVASDVNEMPETILNSISNFFLPQIMKAGAQDLELPVLLATHAIIQTVAEKIFGRRGPAGTLFYLQHFVDGPTPEVRFSPISAEIHEVRNVVAHQWMSSVNHGLAIDYTISQGWIRRGTVVHFNPRIYLAQFSQGFQGPIWNYATLAPAGDLLLRKYEFLADWLDLQPKDSIRSQIKQLSAAAPGAARDAIEQAIQQDVRARYKL